MGNGGLARKKYSAKDIVEKSNEIEEPDESCHQSISVNSFKHSVQDEAGGDASQLDERDQSIDIAEEDSGFHDKYIVERKLGDGSFGVVYQCRHRETHITYAVKMVDMDEHQQCLQEVEIMRKIARWSKMYKGIVQLVDYFQDRDSCFIVMQAYNGGDLIEVVQHHLAKGISDYDRVLSRLFKQMTQAIAFLHSLQLMHRDVKGESFLLDRFDIYDEGIRVILIDLGTAAELNQPGEKLSAQVGTRIYWAPEVVNQCYSFPADVWALGIILYGILCGTFPFKSDDEILTKEPGFFICETLTTNNDAVDFLQALMRKDQDSRPTADDALKLAWMAPATGSNPQAGDKSNKEEKLHHKEMDDLRVKREHSIEIDGVFCSRIEITKRRSQKLIGKRSNAKLNRLGTYNETKQTTQETLGPFTTRDADRNLVTHWDWWSVKKMKVNDKLPRSSSARILRAHTACFGLQVSSKTDLKDSWTPDAVADFLHKKGIDVSAFGVGRAKTLADIAKELREGESVFMEDGKGNFYRIVDIVVLRVIGPAGRILVETWHERPNGMKVETKRLPGTKKRPTESKNATAGRLMSEFVGCAPEHLDFIAGTNEFVLEFAESPVYPGVQTLYRKYISEARFSTKDDDILRMHGLPECNEFKYKSPNRDVRTWAWWSLQKCEDHGLAVIGSMQQSSFEGMKLADPSLHVWTADSIRQKLTEHGINTALYGQGRTKSLEDVAKEVQRGDFYLMERKGKILRVVEDSVLIRVLRRDGGEDKVLVEVKQILPDGTSKRVEGVPCCARTPGDNVWHAAQRLLETIPSIAHENFRIHEGQEQLVEEGEGNDAYPELNSLFRKHYVDAVFADGKDQVSSSKSGYL